MRDIIYIVAMNTLPIYKMIESLAKSVKNRRENGLPVSTEHLANCSSMKAIVRMACKFDGGYITKEEKAAGAKHIAEYIIEDLAK